MKKHSHTKLSKAMLYTRATVIMSIVTAIVFAMVDMIAKL